MAILPNTRLEDWDVATANIGGILNSNFVQLELIFDPDASQHLFGVGNIIRDSVWRDGVEALSGTTPDIDFVLKPLQKLTLSGDTIFTVSNATRNKFVTLWLVADGSLRLLTWPGSIVFVGADNGADIAASKNAWVKLHCVDTTGPVILAEFLEEL